MFAVMFLALGIGYGEQIRDPVVSLFSCMPGDTISGFDTSIFQDSFWVETQRLEVSLNEDSIILLVYSWPGNAASLSVFKVIENGYKMVGEFTSCFGGNGIDFVISDKIITTPNDLEFRLDWTGYLRAYYWGDEGTQHVQSSSASSWVVMRTDASELFVVSDSSK